MGVLPSIPYRDSFYASVVWPRKLTFSKLACYSVILWHAHALLVLTSKSNFNKQRECFLFFRIPAFGYYQLVRVCNPCYALIDDMFCEEPVVSTAATWQEGWTAPKNLTTAYLDSKSNGNPSIVFENLRDNTLGASEPCSRITILVSICYFSLTSYVYVISCLATSWVNTTASDWILFKTATYFGPRFYYK